MRPAWAFPLFLLLLAGCLGITDLPGFPEGEVPPEPGEVPVEDYSYDLVIKDISTVPEAVHVGERFSMKAIVQIYGRYTPSTFRLQVIDGEDVLHDKVIENPGLIEWVEFNLTAENYSQRNLRAEVTSLDPFHPEPEENLENNILRKTLHFYPHGFYDVYDWKISWYYDIVSYIIRQAQAFTLPYEMEIFRVGVYIKAASPPPEGSHLIIELHEDDEGEISELIASTQMEVEDLDDELQWKYVYFEGLTLPPGKYWLVLMMDDSGSYGIEWARARGDHYGEYWDTQVFNLGDWADWEYKEFDFAFKIN